MKPFDWLSKKKEKRSTWGYRVTPEQVYSEHHYILKRFGVLLIDLESLNEGKQVEFVNRFSSDYKFLVKMPVWSYVYQGNSSFLDTMKYVNKILAFSDKIVGVVLETGLYDVDKKTAVNHLNSVFIERLLGPLTRKGLGLYLMNGYVKDGRKGITISDILKLKKLRPGLKLILNLHNSFLSGARFMEVYKESKSLGGLSNNFDAILLTSTVGGVESVPLCKGDKYTLHDYKMFLSEFKGKLVIYKGDFDNIVRFIDKLDING